MTTLKIDAEEAYDIVNNDHHDWDVIETVTGERNRHDVDYHAIVKHNPTGKHYWVNYCESSKDGYSYDTDEMFWYEKEVEFFEVVKKIVEIEKWVNV